MMPMLDEAVEIAAGAGAHEIVIGMAHRGRLNVLVHTGGLSYESVLREFEGERTIDAVIAASPTQLAEYRAGKDKLFGFFVGQVMKATQGKANPAQLNELLKRKLGG